MPPFRAPKKVDPTLVERAQEEERRPRLRAPGVVDLEYLREQAEEARLAIMRLQKGAEEVVELEAEEIWIPNGIALKMVDMPVAWDTIEHEVPCFYATWKDEGQYMESKNPKHLYIRHREEKKGEEKEKKDYEVVSQSEHESVKILDAALEKLRGKLSAKVKDICDEHDVYCPDAAEVEATLFGTTVVGPIPVPGGGYGIEERSLSGQKNPQTYVRFLFAKIEKLPSWFFFATHKIDWVKHMWRG